MTERLEIIDYFEALINEIDLKAENLLTKIPQPYQGLVNSKRGTFIDEIERVKAYNLSNLNNSQPPYGKDSLFRRYCFILDMDQINGKRFMSNERERLEEERQANMNVERSFMEMIDKTFGVLIILDGYLSDWKICLFKEVLHFHVCYFPYDDQVTGNECEQANEDDHRRILFLINVPKRHIAAESGRKSNIFHTDSHDLTQLHQTIWLQYEIFKKPKGFIIKTTEKELFKLNYLNIYRVIVDWINDEALYLFGGDFSFSFHINSNSMQELNDSMNFLHRLQTRVNLSSVNVTLHYYFNMDLPDLERISNLYQLKLCTNRHLSKDSTQTTDRSLKMSNLGHLKTLEIDFRTATEKTIDNGTFCHLTGLKQLTLSGCQYITLLNVSKFIGLVNLVELNLPSNGIDQIEPGMFDDLVNLGRLDLKNNMIEKFLPNALRGLGNLKQLDLYSNRFESLPNFDGYLPNLTQLVLSFNRLSALESDAFAGLANLQTLYLDNNNIDRIDINAFSSLKSLSVLDLTFNQLESVQPGLFNETITLRQLILANNKIESVCFDSMPILKVLNLSCNESLAPCVNSFDKLTNLEELDLSRCSIKRLSDVHLRGLTNLSKINLESNEIESLAGDDFAGLSRLRQLQMGKNNISRIEPRTFDSRLEFLSILDISENSLTQMDHDPFGNLTNLSELSLKGNNIDWQWTLEHLSKLVRVDLSNANITQIRPDFFGQLTNLQSLTLVGNQISSLPVRAFYGLSKLESLFISENRIQIVDERAFNGLTNLKCLSLYLNQIENLDFLNTDSLMNLKYLHLHDNKITKIEAGSFDKLLTLMELNLGNNSIREIHPNSFSRLFNLRNVNLYGNFIETFDFSIFSGLETLTYLTTNVFNHERNRHIVESMQNLKNLSVFTNK